MNRLSAHPGIRAAIIVAFALLAGTLAGCDKPSKEDLLYSAQTYYWQGEYRSALGPLTEALDYNAADPNVLYLMGRCHQRLHNPREAMYWYSRTLANFPGHRGASEGLEECRREVGADAPQTAADVGADLSASDKRERAMGLVRMAEEYARQSQQNEAERRFQEAIAVDGNLAFPHAALGRYYLQTGRNDLAKDELKRALQLNPDEPGVKADLARLGG
ncbi:MAG: hypothetical protein BIFFINMI_03921 [Phycisphaerae bacterium]|nr:hypothetical protein [Phycisphaerae bacterium]